MGFLTRIASAFQGKSSAVEGQYRPGPYYLPVEGGWLPAEAGQNINYWQLGHNVRGGNTTAIVEACVSAYSQTIAMCPGDHWYLEKDGGRTRVENSALTRILRQPNGYQSISDFLLNAVRALYLDGNAYALALRNSRFEIVELHLMHPRMSKPMVSVKGDVFYQLGGNQIIDRQLDAGTELIVPARDVLHLRLHTPRHPLWGETPLMAAAADIAASGAMTEQQFLFYNNQARPSFVLSTDLTLTPPQVEELRERWNKQSQGLNTGGTPILTAGLKPQKLTSDPKDAQFADVMKMTEQHVALVFRVPLQVLGIGGTPLASTEALMQLWKATGLGFALNHIEEAIGLMFGLKGQPKEYLEFNTKAMMRSLFKEQVEALAVGVHGAVFAPNEARAEMELPAVEYGDEPRVQQQDVPLSYGANLEPNPAPAALPAPPEKPALPAPPPKGLIDADKLRNGFRRSHAQHSA